MLSVMFTGEARVVEMNTKSNNIKNFSIIMMLINDYVVFILEANVDVSRVPATTAPEIVVRLQMVVNVAKR